MTDLYPSRGPATDADLAGFARHLRAESLRMITRAKGAHIGSCLSVADILAVLYGGVLRIDPARPDWPERDRLIMSKGHAAAVTYVALAANGFFPTTELEQYSRNGSKLYGHVTHRGVPGVELSTGSLGHGLPVACGMALVSKRDRCGWRVFVVLSDGELDEGSNWEAILFAGHHQLGNLITVIDYNKIQSLDRVSMTLDLEPLVAKFQAFRWETAEVDGHDISGLRQALGRERPVSGPPLCVIAHTVKGKGVSWMEDTVFYHYRNLEADELNRALAEVDP